MIVTVTANPALDVTYRLGALVAGQVNRVRAVHARAGGKGVNVARALAALGDGVLVLAPVGGDTGERFAADLRAVALPAVLLPIEGDTRRTVAVVDDNGQATGLYEPGPRCGAAQWAALRGRVAEVAAGAAAVVLAGSLPPGSPDGGYRELAAAAASSGAAVLLDADAADLRRGVCDRVDVAKPNVDELRRATGTTDPFEGARALRAAGAGAVVVSLGAEGLIAVTGQGDWRAAVPRRMHGNPTGAGDAALAALAHGLVTGQSWPRVLAGAIALSASAVSRPVAGEVDLDLYRELLDQVRVEPA